MTTKKRILVIVGCILYAGSIFAGSLQLAHEITLNKRDDVKTHLYLLHNISKESLWLVHENKHPSASAGWPTQIDPDHWTVLLLSRPNFVLTCHLVNANPGKALVSCVHFVQVMQIKNYTIPEKAKKMSYWVVENVSKTELPGKMKARGFVWTGLEVGAQ